MQVIDFLLVLARRKVYLLMAIAAVAMVGFLAADRWSWPAFVLLIVLLFAIILFWALMTFWLAVVRDSQRPET
ncbi:MAG TPA: hypothetical protein VFK79_07270 [Xanthobacteraceae bacterium]|nr:hypothetical protein [Xanthobacteraceae bacterium]